MYIKRYKPLKRNKPLSARTSNISSGRNVALVREETRKPIPKISEGTIESSKKYSNIRRVFLLLFPVCQAGLAGCTHNATDIHHKKGRGIFKLIIKYFLSVCRSCHDKIEANSSYSISAGLSLSRYKIENRYLQPYDSITIRVLFKMGCKLDIISHKQLIINKS